MFVIFVFVIFHVELCAKRNKNLPKYDHCADTELEELGWIDDIPEELANMKVRSSCFSLNSTQFPIIPNSSSASVRLCAWSPLVVDYPRRIQNIVQLRIYYGSSRVTSTEKTVITTPTSIMFLVQDQAAFLAKTLSALFLIFVFKDHCPRQNFRRLNPMDRPTRRPSPS